MYIYIYIYVYVYIYIYIFNMYIYIKYLLALAFQKSLDKAIIIVCYIIKKCYSFKTTLQSTAPLRQPHSSR